MQRAPSLQPRAQAAHLQRRLHPTRVCAGTGGSLLVIGSAAGVAFMSIESAGFAWYARRITPWAAAGYAAALGTYALLHGLPPGPVA